MSPCSAGSVFTQCLILLRRRGRKKKRFKFISALSDKAAKYITNQILGVNNNQEEVRIGSDA